MCIKKNYYWIALKSITIWMFIFNLKNWWFSVIITRHSKGSEICTGPNFSPDRVKTPNSVCVFSHKLYRIIIKKRFWQGFLNPNPNGTKKYCVRFFTQSANRLLPKHIQIYFLTSEVDRLFVAYLIWCFKSNFSTPLN